MYYDKNSLSNANEVINITGENYSTTIQQVTGFNGRFDANKKLSTSTADFVKEKLFIIRRTSIELLDEYFQCSEEELEIRIISCGWM